MTRTYVPGSGEPVHQVRELIGDADSTRFVLEDETIQALLTATENNISAAAARAARLVYNRMLREPDRSIGDISVTRARAENYLTLVQQLEQSGATYGTMSAGGISRGAEAVLLGDTDWEPHSFGVGFMDRRGGYTGGRGDGCC